MTHDTHILPHPEDSFGLLDTATIFGANVLSDDQILGALLEPDRQSLASEILKTAGTLSDLAEMGPLELMALGLNESEAARIVLQGEFTKRVMSSFRRRRLGGLEMTLSELRLRGRQWPRETAGIIGADQYGRITLDRILFEGSRTGITLDLTEVMREALRAGCSGILLYRWQPTPKLSITTDDFQLCDELRLMGSALRISILDYLVVCEDEYYTARADKAWVN
jgi:DNA repair protein RadC